VKRRTVFTAFLLIIHLFAASQLSSQKRPQPPAPTSPAATGPLSPADVIEGLYSLGSVAKVEDLVKKRGVTFYREPIIVDILKQFGATERLLSLIPAPPPPPQPKYAGSLRIRCIPVDCMVIVGERFYGSTQRGQTVIDQLPPGETVVQVLSEGYPKQDRKLQLVQDSPFETTFELKKPPEIGMWIVKETWLETLRVMGGIDGMSSLGEFEGEGTLDWVDNTAQTQHWPMTFTKRSGNDMTVQFKTKDGQCSVSILASDAPKHECKGKLKNSGEETADLAATLFSHYQVQEILQQVLGRLSGFSVGDGGQRLEISGSYDSYVLSLDKDKLPSELLYSLTEKPDSAVKVKYSNYIAVGKARYPAQMEVVQANKNTSWGFNLTTIRSKSTRLQ